MDLNFTPEEDEFRLKVRRFLEENVPKSGLGDGREGREDKAWLARAKGWQHKLYEAGCGAMAWPNEFGHGSSNPRRMWATNELRDRRGESNRYGEQERPRAVEKWGRQRPYFYKNTSRRRCRSIRAPEKDRSSRRQRARRGVRGRRVLR